MFAIVDDEDYEKVNKYIWNISKTHGPNASGGIWMSHLVYGKVLKKGEKITFKNGDRKDCRKSNLVVVNQNDILKRRRGNSGSSSKYKGVSYYKQGKKWRARIQLNGKQKLLGYFASEDEAAKAYNKAALELFGDHAYQNVLSKNNNSDAVAIETKKMPQLRSSKNKKIKYKGVYTNHNKYQARVRENGSEKYLGTFDTPEQAAKAYDKKAYELYGDKAILNFPEKKEEYNVKSNV